MRWAQLSEYRLIDWTPLEDKSGMGLLSGFAKINDFGVKVLEGGVASPIRISIDEGRRTTIPQQEQAPIGPSNPQQQQVIVEALEKASFRVLDSHDKKRSVFRKMREDSPRFRGND